MYLCGLHIPFSKSKRMDMPNPSTVSHHVSSYDNKSPSVSMPIPSTGEKLETPSVGYRIKLDTSMPVRSIQQILDELQHTIPTYDANGWTPVYIASALMPRSVHPCKFVPGLGVRVPYGGQELEHRGRFDILPLDPYQMEWVPTSRGRLPPGRRPIEGGFEEDGRPLYHAMGKINNVSVPGKTGIHLGACHIAFGCSEIKVKDGYYILCWR